MDQYSVIYTKELERVPAVDDPLVEMKDLKSRDVMMETLKLTNFDAAKGSLWGNKPIEYRFNVNGFCRKSFAQIDAAFRRAAARGKFLY